LCIAAENPGFIDFPFSAAINKLYQAESDRLDATCMMLYQQYLDMKYLDGKFDEEKSHDAMAQSGAEHKESKRADQSGKQATMSEGGGIRDWDQLAPLFDPFSEP